MLLLCPCVCILHASRASRSHEQLSLHLAPCHSGAHTRDCIARRIREAPSTSLLFIYIKCNFPYSNNILICAYTCVYPFIQTAICTSTELHHRPILFFGPSRTNGRFFRLFNKSLSTGPSVKVVCARRSGQQHGSDVRLRSSRIVGEAAASDGGKHLRGSSIGKRWCSSVYPN